MATCFLQPHILTFTEMATSISELKQAHAHMIKTTLIHDTFSATRLLASTAAISSDNTHQSLTYAHSIFSHIPNPNSYTYNSIIRAYANSPDPEHAFRIFLEMVNYGMVCPDKYSYTFVLKGCASFSGLEEGRQVMGHVLKDGICWDDVYVQNTLIHMFAKCGCFEVARKVLDLMPVRDVVSWNGILSAYVELGMMDLACGVFDEMGERNLESWNFMISGFVGVGEVEEARRVFDEMPVRNVVSWNALITGYAKASFYNDALVLFEAMQTQKVKPDNCTLVNVLSACARVGALSQGKWVHTYIVRNEIKIDGFIATALVDMYSKCGNLEKALDVFDKCSKKDISTWNSMISGLSTHGFGERSIDIFSQMLVDGQHPNEVTFIGVLSACSRAGLLNKGREMFDIMVRVYEIQPTIEHYGCMVDLLGRHGLLEEAMELVKTMPVKVAPVIWESLLSSCKKHGNFELAKHVAEKLLELNPQDSAGYVQLSNTYASMGKWKNVNEVRKMMRSKSVSKEPGCSMIEVNGVVHEFLAGEGIIS